MHQSAATLRSKGPCSDFKAAFHTTFTSKAFSTNSKFPKLHLTAPKNTTENQFQDPADSNSTGELLRQPLAQPPRSSSGALCKPGQGINSSSSGVQPSRPPSHPQRPPRGFAGQTTYPLARFKQVLHRPLVSEHSVKFSTEIRDHQGPSTSEVFPTIKVRYTERGHSFLHHFNTQRNCETRSALKFSWTTVRPEPSPAASE